MLRCKYNALIHFLIIDTHTSSIASTDLILLDHLLSHPYHPQPKNSLSRQPDHINTRALPQPYLTQAGTMSASTAAVLTTPVGEDPMYVILLLGNLFRAISDVRDVCRMAFDKIALLRGVHL